MGGRLFESRLADGGGAVWRQSAAVESEAVFQRRGGEQHSRQPSLRGPAAPAQAAVLVRRSPALQVRRHHPPPTHSASPPASATSPTNTATCILPVAPLVVAPLLVAAAAAAATDSLRHPLPGPRQVLAEEGLFAARHVAETKLRTTRTRTRLSVSVSRVQACGARVRSRVAGHHARDARCLEPLAPHRGGAFLVHFRDRERRRCRRRPGRGREWVVGDSPKLCRHGPSLPRAPPVGWFFKRGRLWRRRRRG
mmetsp:Transcript_47193/g.93497  ORF Transcript_47193/g.93497 Transcript_47193/m.93497 type:complete len:252 (-) Transcript_47193:594-1349(-)